MYKEKRAKSEILPNSAEWWKNFTHKLFKSGDLLYLANEILNSYPHLSADHLYHVVIQIARFINYEFSAVQRQSDAEQIKAIRWLVQIINHQVILSKQICGSSHLANLSELNAGKKETLEWLLNNEAVGPHANELAPVENMNEYSGAVKVIIRTLADNYLRNFYNYMASKPVLNETQQIIINELSPVLQEWQTRLPMEHSSIFNVKNKNRDILLAQEPSLKQAKITP